MFLFRLVETVRTLFIAIILLVLLRFAFVAGYRARDNPFLIPIAEFLIGEE